MVRSITLDFFFFFGGGSVDVVLFWMFVEEEELLRGLLGACCCCGARFLASISLNRRMVFSLCSFKDCAAEAGSGGNVRGPVRRIV